MKSTLAWVLAVSGPFCFSSAALEPGVQVSFVTTKAKTRRAERKDQNRPFPCVTLRITNNTRWPISGALRCYNLVADRPDRSVMYPNVPCGGCGDFFTFFTIKARQSDLICVQPEDLGPGFAIGLGYWTRAHGTDAQELYFGHSDLPASVRDTITKAGLRPCVYRDGIPEPRPTDFSAWLANLDVPPSIQPPPPSPPPPQIQ
jgi:hypothetical protein